MIWKTCLESGSELGQLRFTKRQSSILWFVPLLSMISQASYSSTGQAQDCLTSKSQTRKKECILGICSTAYHCWGSKCVFCVTDTCFRNKRHLSPRGSLICIPSTKQPASAKQNEITTLDRIQYFELNKVITIILLLKYSTYGGKGMGTFCFQCSDKHLSQQPAVLCSPLGITLKSIAHSGAAATRDQGALTLEHPTSHQLRCFPSTHILHHLSTLSPIPMQKEYTSPALQHPQPMGCKESSLSLSQPYEKSTFLPLKIPTTT